MFLFLKLVLAHMVADFILQFEELYQLKLKSWLGHAGHVLMHLLMMIVLTLPYLSQPAVWVFILAITAVHYLQDQIKYSLQAKNPENTFWYFTIDQVFHLLFISTVFLLPASREILSLGSGKLHKLYTSNTLTLLLIAFIGVTFKSSYFLHSFRKTFMPRSSRPDHFITSFEMAWALFERTWILGCFLVLSPLSLSLSVIPGIFRPLSPKLRNLPDFIMSYVYAAAAGLIFRHWIPL